jgi:hypothetical protein
MYQKDALKAEALEKLREAEKTIYKWACEEDVGDTRTYAFNLYEIVRTAPREAKQ